MERNTLKYFCNQCDNFHCKKKTLATCKGFAPLSSGDRGYSILMKEWKEFIKDDL